MSDAIAPCPARRGNNWQPERECQTCRRYLRPDMRVPALRPMPEPCANHLPMPGMDYTDY